MLISTQLEDGVMIIRMQDKAGKNAFSKAFLAEYRATLSEAQNNPEVRVVLLCGLPDVFCSGAPKELLKELVDKKVSPDDLILPREMLSMRLPCVAAMQGHATGGGLALGLCADMVVFARQSRYGANFMNMGFTPGMGMTCLLEHVLPPALAHEMLYTGAYYRGSFFEPHCGGGQVVNKEKVEDVALALAEQMAEKPRKALELLKESLSAPRLQRYEEAFKQESRMHDICFQDEEIRHRIEENYVE